MIIKLAQAQLESAEGAIRKSRRMIIKLAQAQLKSAEGATTYQPSPKGWVEDTE